jgi:hypothetical protein
MLLKSDLKRIAKERLVDAETLFNVDRLDGATYLCGYVIEIVLKLRICKTLKWEGFPDSRREFEKYASFKTHDFDSLLHLSGVEDKVKQSYLSEWSIVKTWNPELRYNRVVSRNRTETIRKRSEVADIISATKTLMNAL